MVISLLCLYCFFAISNIANPISLTTLVNVDLFNNYRSENKISYRLLHFTSIFNTDTNILYIGLFKQNGENPKGLGPYNRSRRLLIFNAGNLKNVIEKADFIVYKDQFLEQIKMFNPTLNTKGRVVERRPKNYNFDVSRINIIRFFFSSRNMKNA